MSLFTGWRIVKPINDDERSKQGRTERHRHLANVHNLGRSAGREETTLVPLMVKTRSLAVVPRTHEKPRVMPPMPAGGELKVAEPVSEIYCVDVSVLVAMMVMAPRVTLMPAMV